MRNLGWADALIICLVIFSVFVLGWIVGRHERKPKHIPWHRNAQDPRDAQTYWNRIWRHR